MSINVFKISPWQKIKKKKMKLADRGAFLKRIKRKARKVSLRNKEGTIATDREGILERVRAVYATLYRKFGGK